MYKLTIQDSFKKLLPEIKESVGFNLLKLFKGETIEEILYYDHLIVESDNSYDYLGYENNNFTYCQHSRLKNGGYEKNKLSTPSIQSILQHIFNNSEYKGKFKEKDFYNFSNKILAKMAENLKMEFPTTKEEILEAFNYTNKVNRNVINSCANFNHNSSWEKPKESWYDFYINNTDKCQIIIIRDGDMIVGRSYFFFGEQQIDTEYGGRNKRKKGEKVKFYNNIYGTIPTVQAKIREFFQKENIKPYSDSIFVLKYDICKEFPPVDFLLVDEDNGWISTGNYRKDLYLPSSYKFKSRKLQK
jgi:hypothetical protein